MAESDAPKMGSRYPDWGWCWECRREVPLLSGNEAQDLNDLLMSFIKDVQEYRKRHGATIAEAYEGVGNPVVDRYRALTGDDPLANSAWRDPHGLAFHLVKHRPDKFGPPCWNCGRLLRTPKAKYCAECMASRSPGKFEPPMT